MGKRALSAHNYNCLSFGVILLLGKKGRLSKPWQLPDSPVMDRKMEDGYENRQQGEGKSGGLGRAAVPYLFLSGLTILVLMVPGISSVLGQLKIGFPVPETVTGYGHVNAASAMYAPIAPLTHASMFLLVSSAAGIVYYRKIGWLSPGQGSRILYRTTKMAFPSAAAVL